MNEADTMDAAPFERGDEVRLLDNPNKRGVVLSVRMDSQFGEWMVRVRVDGRPKLYMAEDLEPIEDEPADSWADVADGILAPAASLRTLLTYERLRRPPGPVGRSFGTARAKLYPYQFKPLVKFLDNPAHTLLIADEVGLGKTIEAGYILREWKERQTVETVLIVVPARLRTKWKNELQLRFGETFETVKAREVRAMLKRVRQGRDPEPFQWIASYESLRLPDIVDGLTQASPPLDLVILDEAHRVRNRETHQFRLARALARAAQAMVYLTATPVQTSLDNLHTLVDLLQPGVFGTPEDFARRVEANRPVMWAAAAAAAGDFRAAASHLASLGNHPMTRGLLKEPIVLQISQQLLAETEPTRRSRVLMQRSISELNPTGQIISRTRKAEVFENRARRTAQPVFVELNEDELGIYAIVAEVTRLLHPDASTWGRSMAALTAYRYTASCIPAAVGYLRSRLTKAGFSIHAGGLDAELELELLEEEYGSLDETVSSQAATTRISQALALCPTPDEDSKLQELLCALRAIRNDDAQHGRKPRKVIIFSFFKRTLGYLAEQLSDAGFSNTLIHGSIPILEREDRIEHFLRDPDLNVLLSSEVGGEGLDLQAASVVVNYDLPWNPMVVEQRIGRVDRIGQESDRIVIINMVCSGTVEDRILHRLYDRVDLFEASIGEMEDILGSREVRDLIVAQLKGDLTASELEERVEQTARAALHRRQNAEQLSQRVDGLLAADQAILDQIRVLVDGCRLPSERDIATLLRGFLEAEFAGIRIHGDPTRQIAEIDLPDDARVRLARWSEANNGIARALVADLRRGPVRFTVSSDIAMRSARTMFVQARHPLVQFAVDTMAQKASAQGAAFGARLFSESLAPGHWLVGIWSVATKGGEQSTELSCATARLGSTEVLVGDEAEPMLEQLLADFHPLDPPPLLEVDEVHEAAELVLSAFESHTVQSIMAGRDLAALKQVRKRATWQTTLEQQVARAQAHLDQMVAQGAAPFAVKMAKAKLGKRQQELQRVTGELAHEPEFGLVPTEIATVLVQVEVP